MSSRTPSLLVQRIQRTLSGQVPHPEEVAGYEYEHAFARAEEATARVSLRLEEERIAAPSVAARLLGILPHRRVSALAADSGWSTWGTVERLLMLSQEAGAATEALEAAGLAVQVARSLDHGRYGAAPVHDLLAQALGYQADALRAVGRFAEARRVFGEAGRVLHEGSHDRLDVAQLAGLRARLATAEGDFEGALSLLERARKIYRVARSPHLEGRVFVRLAQVHSYRDPDRALAAASKALERLDAMLEPKLLLVAHHLVTWSLVDLGRTGEALTHLAQSRYLYASFPTSHPRLVLSWLEARINRGLGRLSSAEEIFRLARLESARAGRAYDTTLITLDLCETWIAQGRVRRARALLAAHRPLLAQWGLQDAGLRAWDALEGEVRDAVGTTGLVTVTLHQTAHLLRRRWARLTAPSGR